MKVATTVTPTGKPTSELICAWLGLSGSTWPPDHYTLLGLSPGEADPLRIEGEVQVRLNRVRSYQLSHPAAATEAMNLLAQAFCCLTDKHARQAYDARLGIRPVVVPVTTHIAELPRSSKLTQVPQASTDTAVSNPVTQVDWGKTTPPTPGPVPSPPEAIPVLEAMPAPAAAIPVQATPVVVGEPVAPPPAVVPSPPKPIDPIFTLACKSQAARRGLGTRRGLYERIQVTRQLLRAWQKLGKYLSKPTCKLTNATAEAELTRRLVAVFEGLEGFPPILGHPGQPGYRVAAIAEQETSADIFKRLDLEQRTALTRDWTDGGNVLQAHLQFLRSEVDTLRRCGLMERLLRTVQWLLRDHAGWVWLGLGVVTAVIVALVVRR